MKYSSLLSANEAGLSAAAGCGLCMSHASCMHHVSSRGDRMNSQSKTIWFRRSVVSIQSNFTTITNKLVRALPKHI